MALEEIIGLMGTILIVIGWGFEIRQIIRRNHSPLDLNFGIMYLAGSIMLMAYALAINAPIFAFLNFLAAAMALLALYYKWHEKKKHAHTIHEHAFHSTVREIVAWPKTKAKGRGRK
ncbi:TPA: hypothetical protein HA244_07195 [Candidatus Micrarchaeota archaeon]|nr:hypothetical protein [Candidatus Micrarchaeota archaeon]